MLASTGIILTTSYDWTLKVWSLRGQCLVSRKAHHGQVLDFSVSSKDDAAPLEYGEVGKMPNGRGRRRRRR